MPKHTITFSLSEPLDTDVRDMAHRYGIPVSEYIRFCLYKQARVELRKRNQLMLGKEFDTKLPEQFVLPGQLELEVRA